MLLVGVALLLLLTGLDAPSDVLWVLGPLSVGLVALALAAMALVPLRYDGPRAKRLVATAFRLLALVGGVVTLVTVVAGSGAWVLLGVVPLVVCGALVTDSARLVREAGPLGTRR